MLRVRIDTASPAYTLHALVTHLDRAADGILRERFGVSYARYLALLTIARLEGGTQKSVADELGLSEPSVSRTVVRLAADSLVTVEKVAGKGNRRRVSLTEDGLALAVSCSDVLEAAFATVMDAAAVTADDVVDLAGRMLAVIRPPEPGGTR